MSTVILIVLMTTGSSYRPPSVVQVEFNNTASCQVALDYFQRLNSDKAKFAGGGCFRKMQ